jgi:hypothetical protein
VAEIRSLLRFALATVLSFYKGNLPAHDDTITFRMADSSQEARRLGSEAEYDMTHSAFAFLWTRHSR